MLAARSGDDELDATAMRAEIERALAAMDDVRRIKSQLTNASNGSRNNGSKPQSPPLKPVTWSYRHCIL